MDRKTGGMGKQGQRNRRTEKRLTKEHMDRKTGRKRNGGYRNMLTEKKMDIGTD